MVDVEVTVDVLSVPVFPPPPQAVNVITAALAAATKIVLFIIVFDV
jgi:hypothetical protein